MPSTVPIFFGAWSASDIACTRPSTNTTTNTKQLRCRILMIAPLVNGDFFEQSCPAVVACAHRSMVRSHASPDIRVQLSSTAIRGSDAAHRRVRTQLTQCHGICLEHRRNFTGGSHNASKKTMHLGNLRLQEAQEAILTNGGR